MAKFGIGARAVDLLGRQQVAGTPTAISELFKNAHDAYAKAMVVDFYRVRNLLILRDDGIGMSRTDFETRWLTAATDSKRAEGYLPPPDTDPDQAPRPVMGEKGIGRLAIAVLGKQVLVLTRKKTSDNSASLVAALLHWDIFSLPNVQLGDLDIPLRELPGGSLPDKSVIADMVLEAQRNLTELRPRTDPAMIASILADLGAFDVDPAALADIIMAGPDLRENGYGTHFYISPTNETLALDVDEVGEGDKATPMQKALLGFSNTMVPGHAIPPMTTSFRDHRGGGLWDDIIGSNNFFSPGDFERSDHQVTGDFDEFGQFSGTIKVFGSEAKPFAIHWPNGRGQNTRCGPFQISFAYVQGKASESSLRREDWSELMEKLNRIGGLYLYRDNIRILPYGDSDYDFLDIERRRTKSAAYYFFSYRRMLGVIETTRKKNSGLVEKAGREGFQANIAYKEFKNILENFFIQLAAEFFREGGASSDEFLALRQQNAKNFEVLRKRERQVANQRRKLTEGLNKFFEGVQDNSFEESTRCLVDEVDVRLAAFAEGEVDVGEFRRLERKAFADLAAISDQSKVTRPRAVGLTRDLSRQWASYEVQRKRLEDDVYSPSFELLRDKFTAAVDVLGLARHARQMAYDTISELTTESERYVRRLSSEVKSDADGFHDRAVKLTKESIRSVRATIESKLVDFERQALADMDPDKISLVQINIENEIREETEKQAELLRRLADHIAAVSVDGPSNDELLTAMETDLEDRRDREEQSMRLAQMGQAVGIVHHEFSAAIRSVRQNVRRLATWADRNEKFRVVYNELTDSYAHLDSYLSLFAPLNRGLSQTKRTIRGADISQYLSELLGDRLRRHGVELIATEAFKEFEVESYVSTLYPAFVNLVDNAIYWLEHGQHLHTDDARPKQKVITLDVIDDALVVSDTGPGILPADELSVFETGYSRKPGGSGLGLSITKDVLEREGFRLDLAPYNRDRGATFRITPPLEDAP